MSFEAASWWEVFSRALGEVDAMKFQHDFAPEAEGRGFVGDEVEGDANDLTGVSGALENGADEDVLVSIDGLDVTGCFHGTAEIP